MICPVCRGDGISASTEICPHCGAYLPSLMRDMLTAGTMLRQGTYRIDEVIGRGGFGVTYKAFHTKLAQPVAIKEYFPQDFAVRNTANGELKVLTTYETVYQNSLKRFTREGRLLAKLDNLNIVGVHDLFEENGTAYLVMDLLNGRTLEQELKAQHKLSPKQITEIMEPLVDGLEAIHQSGVYHLDIKPANIMLLFNDKVVLLDFGAARVGVSKRSTQPFTLEYAAPEVIAGHDVGVESDIFSLGMTLYEMLTGEPPVSALSRLLEDTWQPQHLEEPWQKLVTTALKISKSERPQNICQWWGKKQKKWWEGIEKSYIMTSDNGQPKKDVVIPPISEAPTVLSLDAVSCFIEDGIVLIGERAIGKTSTVVKLAKGTKHVKYAGNPNDLIARYSNPLTGAIAGTAKMTPETLVMNVDLPAGEKQIPFLWVDTPGEAFSNSKWRLDNQVDWQNIQQTVNQSKAVILLLPPYQKQIIPQRPDLQDNLPTYEDWLKTLQTWLNFIANNCQKVSHILICLHRADTFCNVQLEAKKWRFDNLKQPLWFEYDNYIRKTYFTGAHSLIKEYNSKHPTTSLRFFITSIYEDSLLELPWIYLASFLANT